MVQLSLLSQSYACEIMQTSVSIEKPWQHKGVLRWSFRNVQQWKCTFTFIYGGGHVEKKSLEWKSTSQGIHTQVSGEWDEWMTVNEMMFLCQACVQNAGTSTQTKPGYSTKSKTVGATELCLALRTTEEEPSWLLITVAVTIRRKGCKM